MSKVSITRSLLDDLAMSISAKSGEPAPMTLPEMKDAVDGIQTGGIDGNNLKYGSSDYPFMYLGTGRIGTSRVV